MSQLDKLFEITVDNLAEKQLEALKQDTLNILEKISKYVKEDDFDKIDQYLEFSSSGDGYGDENHYIKFYCGDIDETLRKMKYLKQTLKGSK